MAFSWMVRALISVAGELLAPTRCAACDERVGDSVVFCEGCAASVVRLPSRSPEGAHHAVFAYGGALATAMVRFKYEGRSDLAARFGALMAQHAASVGLAVDLVVPVPLHPRRVVERGFDQTALLAGMVARGLRVAHLPRALVRDRETQVQASLSREARVANVAAAFRCRTPHVVAGRRVLLIDDVRTTGATLEACAVSLSQAGALDVFTFALANRERENGLSLT